MPQMPTRGRGRPLCLDWQQDAEQLSQLYQRERDPEVRPRLHALWLLRQGHSLRATAALLGVHYVTAQKWVAWYRQGGRVGSRRCVLIRRAILKDWLLGSTKLNSPCCTNRPAAEPSARLRRLLIGSTRSWVSATPAGASTSCCVGCATKPKCPAPSAATPLLFSSRSGKKGVEQRSARQRSDIPNGDSLG
jgi:Homeodomain-like domain